MDMNAGVLHSFGRLALPVLVAASIHPLAAQNATTIPVGYIKGVPIGSNATANITANTDVSISLPLKRPVVFASAVASVSGSNVTIQNASFTGNQLTTEPHLLEIASGSGEGVSGLITAHNATTCTVDLPAGLTLNGVVSGDAVRIRKAWTLASLFVNATVPTGTKVLLRSGSSAGINIAPDVTYEYSPADGGWIDGELNDANDVVLFQGEMIIVRTPGSPLSNLTLVGEVPATKFLVPLANVDSGQPQDLFIAYNSPVGEVLGNSNITAIAQNGDKIQIIDNSIALQNKAPSTILEYSTGAGGWLDGDLNVVDDSFVLSPGIGIIYRRATTASTATWVQNPSYLPLQ